MTEAKKTSTKKAAPAATSLKVKVVNLQNQSVGDIDLAPDVFGVEVRKDILARAVHWQLAKRRSGNHKAKEIWAIRGTTKKPWAQKGTGNARQGSLRSPQFRKGAVIFGPVVRDHGYNFPKKVRMAALRCALSAKQAEGKLIILDAAKMDAVKSKTAAAALKKMGAVNVLIIDGSNLDEKFALSVRNLAHVDLLPEQGANVYDILRRDVLVLTKNAVEQLSGRLKDAS
jgi:large subunit ribosomal protein L4